MKKTIGLGSRVSQTTTALKGITRVFGLPSMYMETATSLTVVLRIYILARENRTEEGLKMALPSLLEGINSAWNGNELSEKPSGIFVPEVHAVINALIAATRSTDPYAAFFGTDAPSAENLTKLLSEIVRLTEVE